MAVQTPIDNKSKSKPSTSMTKPTFRIKATFCCEVIHASMLKRLGESGVRSCIMPGLPRHLVQELNAGTVVYPPYLLLRYQAVWHLCGPYNCDGIDHFGQTPIQHSSRDLNSKLDKTLHFAGLRR